jgi:hypothetical protein
MLIRVGYFKNTYLGVVSDPVVIDSYVIIVIAQGKKW